MTWYGLKDAGERAKRGRHGARRRARVAAAATDVPPLSLDEVYARANGYCCRCKLPVPRDQASIEHLTPISKGGKDEPDNQSLSHKTCNSAKGARTGPRHKGLRRTPLRTKRKSKVPDGVDVF